MRPTKKAEKLRLLKAYRHDSMSNCSSGSVVVSYHTDVDPLSFQTRIT